MSPDEVEIDSPFKFMPKSRRKIVGVSPTRLGKLKCDAARLKFLLDYCEITFIFGCPTNLQDHRTEMRINNRRDVDKAMKMEGYK